MLKEMPKDAGTEEGRISHIKEKVVWEAEDDAVASPRVKVASPTRVHTTNPYSHRVYLLRMIKNPTI